MKETIRIVIEEWIPSEDPQDGGEWVGRFWRQLTPKQAFEQVAINAIGKLLEALIKIARPRIVTEAETLILRDGGLEHEIGKGFAVELVQAGWSANPVKGDSGLVYIENRPCEAYEALADLA